MPEIRNKRRYIDISPDWALQPGIFPGDTAYRRKTLMKFPENHLSTSVRTPMLLVTTQQMEAGLKPETLTCIWDEPK